MINDVATHILSYFSYDAYFWPKEYFNKASKNPAKFYFEWNVNQKIKNKLSVIIEDKLKKPYVSEENDKSYPIIMSSNKADADAIIKFEEDGNNLMYEMYIKGELQGTGGFSLEME